MNDDLTRDDLFQAADRLVEETLSAAGVTRPPVDVVDLARRHFGMTVREEAALNPRVRRGAPAMRSGSPPTPARGRDNGQQRVRSARA